MGGSPASRRGNVMNPGPDERPLPSKLTQTIKRGEVFRHELAGAGGWGDPLERDPEAVLRDLRNELIGRDAARDDYGVLIDTACWRVDHAATKERRAALRAARGWAETPVVLFDDQPGTTAKARP